MSAALLFYENLAPLSSKDHVDLYVKSGNDYSFAKKTNSVPVMSVEMPAASADYPIVFAGNEKEVIPVCILGIKDGQNMFVDDKGSWNATYVPAFVRRYPFVFSTSNNGESFTLCIDEEFSGCNKDGKGERLFDTDGERTQYLDGVLNFVQDYQTEFNRTQAFCKKLLELDILEPMHAQVTMSTGEKMSLAGFMAVSREKLKQLSAEDASELLRNDGMELIFTHLHSMKNFNEMIKLGGLTETDKAADSEKKPAAKKAKAKKSSADKTH